MNRAARRQQARNKKFMPGLNFKQRLAQVEQMFGLPKLENGQKVKFNYDFMIRQPDWKSESEELKKWVLDNKDSVLTVKIVEGYKVKSNDKYNFVSLEEDNNDIPFIFRSDAFIPIASATVNLENGDTKTVELGNITDINDPNIMEKVNEAVNNI